MTETNSGASRDDEMRDTAAASESTPNQPAQEAQSPSSGAEHPLATTPTESAVPHVPHSTPGAPAPHSTPGAPAQQPTQPQQPTQQQPTQQPQSTQPLYSTQQTHPTTPFAGSPAPGYHAPAPAQHQSVNAQDPAQAANEKKTRLGIGLAAGLVVGAVIGGASGAGVTAFVAFNQQGSGPVSEDSAADTLIVNDTDSVNEITAAAAKASPSVVTINVAGDQSAGSGSGVVLTEDGYVITNTHVVTLDGATASPAIQVKTSDGSLYDGELVGTDPLSDLAVVKLVDASGLDPIEFADSDQLNVGDVAIAIGAPRGLAGTVTNGIVSALHRSITVASAAAPTTPNDPMPEEEGEIPFDFWNFDLGEPGQEQQLPNRQANATISLPVIQTDAAINPGNSGGALINSDGDLIGVNVAILSASRSSAEAGSIGVGFAVPANLAKRVAGELIEQGVASHGLLGATVSPASLVQGSDTVGAFVEELTPGGPGEEAGLRPGDIVTSFNNVPITDARDLTAQVRALAAGTETELVFERNGEEVTVTVTLGDLQQ